MRMQPVTADLLGRVVQALGAHPIFKGTDARTLSDVAGECVVAHYATDEVLMQQGEKPDTMVALLKGLIRLFVTPDGMQEEMEVAQLRPISLHGELDMLLDRPRQARAVAAEPTLVLQLPAAALKMLFERSPSFGLNLSQSLAQRWRAEAHKIPLPFFDLANAHPGPEVTGLLPAGFVLRQRVLPVEASGNEITVGFVDDPTPHLVAALRQFLPGAALLFVRIDPVAYDEAAQSLALMPENGVGHPGMQNGDDGPQRFSRSSRPEHSLRLSAPKLDPLLRRMVSEGASDLHLSAGHKPRWRIDGEMREIGEAKVLGDIQVYDLLEPGIPDRNRKQFEEDNDTDFAYALPDVARFRVNIFRDMLGVSAVLRQIPQKILTIEQLGLPPVVQRMCDHPKGLVLVTGPTGSGKSTTLAAMVDYINRNRRTHIVTLEDPIEFVHLSQKALVNQREIGPHTTSFARALRAVLREDPDIVLVGELRDQETIALAMETANTGHLVFGTLHTSTAISTIDRIIDTFPSDQQNQVRAVISDCLKGVIAQTLCRKKGGGRVAAIEVLVGSFAVGNLIREGKNHQIMNIMLTAKNQGNTLLNEQLEKLVSDGRVEYDEAIMKAVDKAEFAKRFGKDYFEK